jgi:hypothetical protein
MNHQRKKGWRSLARRTAIACRDLPLIACCVALAVSLEAFAAYGIVTQTPGVFGLLEAALCLSCGLASLAVSAASSDMKRDPRPDVRKHAWKARIVALMLLIPSTYYVSQTFAYQAQVAAWRQFSGSEEEAALRAIVTGASGEYVDSQVRLEAARSLERSQKPERASFDIGSALWAGLILGLNSLAVGVGRRPRPETTSERERRLAQARAAKAARTRARNEKQAAKQQYPAPVPNVRQLVR